MKNIKLIAMDLDGTLSQHKTYLPDKNKEALRLLSKKYKLLMVGAGQVKRIFNQMEHFPVDIIGNYGLQYGTYNENTGSMDIVRDLQFPIDKDSIEERVIYRNPLSVFKDRAQDGFPALSEEQQQAFDEISKKINIDEFEIIDRNIDLINKISRGEI